MSDQSVKRQLGGMPTGQYNMADMQFSVREIKPPKPQEEPAQVTEFDLYGQDYEGITVCASDFSVVLPAVRSAPMHFVVVDGRWVCAPDPAKHADPEPFRELEEAVERMIRIGMLK
jgi:hypothetical protein